MIKLREIKKRDYKKIKHLFLRNKLKITDKINWINLWKNPIIQKSKNKTLGYVIENKNKIVGHIGLFPTEYRFKNKKLNCQVLHGWVIDKAYRNFSISLMNKFFSKNKSDFYLSTTTNKNAGKIMEALGWKKINIKGLSQTSIIILNEKNFLRRIFFNKKILYNEFTIFMLGKILGILFKKNLNKWKNYQSDPCIISYNKFDNKINNFWEKYKRENYSKILIKKNLQWLNWLLGNYLLKKRAKVFVIQENGNIYGYCIYIISKKNKINYAQILDIAVLKSHQKKKISLLRKCINEENKNDCAFFEFRNTYYKNLELLRDFKPININLSNNYFYFKPMIKNNNNIFNFENWHLSSLDGDIALNY